MSAMIISSQLLYLNNKSSETVNSWQQKFLEFNWSVNKASTAAVIHDHFVIAILKIENLFRNWAFVHCILSEASARSFCTTGSQPKSEAKIGLKMAELGHF